MTSSPTSVPSVQSLAPTTSSPTAITTSPTSEPTNEPTKTTLAPTSMPSTNPTVFPTYAPTIPSLSPTTYPTLSPTTKAPSAAVVISQSNGLSTTEVIIITVGAAVGLLISVLCVLIFLYLRRKQKKIDDGAVIQPGNAGIVANNTVSGAGNAATFMNPASQFSSYGMMNPSQFGNNVSQFGTNFASNYGGFSSPYNQNAWAQLNMYPPMLQMAQQLQGMGPAQRQQFLMQQAHMKQEAHNQEYMRVQQKLNQMRNMQQNIGYEQQQGMGNDMEQQQQLMEKQQQFNQNNNIEKDVPPLVVPVRGKGNDDDLLQMSGPGGNSGNDMMLDVEPGLSDAYTRKMQDFTPGD